MLFIARLLSLGVYFSPILKLYPKMQMFITTYKYILPLLIQKGRITHSNNIWRMGKCSESKFLNWMPSSQNFKRSYIQYTPSLNIFDILTFKQYCLMVNLRVIAFQNLPHKYWSTIELAIWCGQCLSQNLCLKLQFNAIISIHINK